MAAGKGLVGVFEYLDDLLGAMETLKKEGVPIRDVFTPVARHEIREALGRPSMSRVKYFTLAGGILGICTGVFLLVYTCLQWKFVVGGKPVVPYPPAVIPAFEFFILVAVLFTLAGMLLLNRMPKLRREPGFDRRFTQDRFGLLVHCTQTECGRVKEMLARSGAEEVHEFSR